MARGLENFSLLGGPLQRFGARLGLVRGESNTLRLGLALGWSAWLVLVALAVAQGAAGDLFALPAIAIHARLLLAIPLFFIAEAALDTKLREFVALLVQSGVAGAKAAPQLEALAARLSDWEDSWVPDTVSLAAAIGLGFLGSQAGFQGSRPILDAAPLAALWYAAICLSLFRFLMFRWVLRLFLWWSLLWRLSRMDLDLSPAHPDHAAGLGYLETVHTRFAPLAFAISVVVAAKLAEEIATSGSGLSDAYPEMATTLFVDAALFLAPLCLFMPKLRACQEKGLRDYGVLGARYTHAFERKWIVAVRQDEPLLGTADLQSLADLANSVEVVRKMRLAPIGMRLLAIIGAAAVLPMLPLFLFDYPLADLARMLFQKLAGL